MLTLHHHLVNRLKIVIALYEGCFEQVNEDHLALGLDHYRSDTIGDQLYCASVSFESMYDTLMKDGDFVWEPSLEAKHAHSYKHLWTYFKKSSDLALMTLEASSDLSPAANVNLAMLIDHLYMHQGQLIRYFYSLNIPQPPAWQHAWGLAD